MTDDTTNTENQTTPPAPTAEAAIALLTENSDRLIQVAENLKKLARHAYSKDNAERRSAELRRENKYNEANFVLNDLDITSAARRLINYQDLGFALNLDAKTTQNAIEAFTQNIADAQAILRNPELMERVESNNDKLYLETVRDLKYLDKLAPQLQTANPLLDEYVAQRTDRRADLIGEEELAADQETRYNRGMKALIASHDHAHKTSPSFRERQKRMKPVAFEKTSMNDEEYGKWRAAEDEKKAAGTSNEPTI